MPGTVNEIENPNPQFQEPTTGGFRTATVAVASAPPFTVAVATAIVPTTLSRALTRSATICSRWIAQSSRTAKMDRYYLLNNYNPGYFGDGSNAYTDHYVYNTPFTIPPTNQRNIGDVLLDREISWKYYGDQWNQYLTDKYQLNYGNRGSEQRPVLQHLQPASNTDFHHDQRCRPHSPSHGHHRPLHRHRQWHAPGSLLRQAQRMGRRPSGFVQVRFVRRIRQENCSGGEGQSRNFGRARPSSSPWMKAAATTTPVTCSRSISSATAPEFR